MPCTLLFIHGRSQQSSDEVAQDPARLAAYVDNKKRDWLGGLAKGLISAGLDPVDPATVLFPYYGNAFTDAIHDLEAHGGHRPMLEDVTADADDLAAAKGKVLLDIAQTLGFDPAAEMAYLQPGVAEAEGFHVGNLLQVPILRAALQFVGRKTGAPSIIIERFLEDVAYYLDVKDVRGVVLSVVTAALSQKRPGDDLVIVSHSLGTIVAYDLLTALQPDYRVRMLVTAGSPLGYPVVQRHLLGTVGAGRPAVPACLPRQKGAWLNAYDVADFVSLVHPLEGAFADQVADQIRDERTHNASDPHSISDYLSDPDVAGPIGRAIA